MSVRFRLPALALFLAVLSSRAVRAQEADLAVTKSGPAQSAADTDVTYTVILTNGGPDAAASVTLSDPLPGTMTFKSATTPAGWSCSTPAVDSGGAITCTIASLSPGTTTFTFVLHIPPGTPPSTFFTNLATASTETFDPNDENNQGVAVTSTPAPPMADIGVTKTGPSAAGRDTDVTYTLLVGNSGADAAVNFELDDTLPGTMTFVSIAQTGTALSCTTPPVGSGGMVACTAPSYAAGSSTTVTLKGHIPAGAGAGDFFQNTASVKSDTADPNDENNVSTTGLTVSDTDLSIIKSGPATATAGTGITYTITLTNNGPDTAENAQFLDNLPSNTTFVSLAQNTGPSANCAHPDPGTGGTVACSIPILGSGSATFTLVVLAGNGALVFNTATASADTFDPNPNNGSSTVTTALSAVSDVGLTKSAATTAPAGTNVTYTLTVTNNGPSTATGVSMTDVLPAGTTFVSIQQTGGPAFSCTGGSTATCTAATLVPGAPATFSLVVALSPSLAPGTVVSNTANVTSGTSDTTPGNNAATANTSTTAAPPTAAAAIPTLSVPAMALLAVALAIGGARLLKVG